MRGNRILFFVTFLLPCSIFGQVGNNVSNGSFERKYSCNPPYSLDKAISWSSIGNDTTKFAGYLYSVNCFSNAPITGVGFQFPNTGQGFYRLTPYCISPCPYYASRGYPRNRLRANLISNKSYCVKMYVSRQNASPYAISNFGFYFADHSIDTIKYCNGPITYITPQVKNPGTNIISDTLNWIPITGTFVATGSEKYLVIGNFDSNVLTNDSLVDTSYGNDIWAEYFIDDVSCIEINLPAYAGPDKSIIPGDSVYIGRESDFAIDPGCNWYKLPNTTTAIDTISGMWVKPTVTTTYVVKQTLDCSPEKWDTVVVHMNLVGIEKLKWINNDLSLSPNPAQNFLQIKFSLELGEEFSRLSIFNSMGLLVKKEALIYKNKVGALDINELADGVYTLTLTNIQGLSLIKKLIISK